jgi:hypothetical protein
MTILFGGDLFPGRRWPLHPQPRDWEGLENWVRRIAAVYGVSYDAFLKHADSDDVARPFRDHVARCSDMMSPV